MTIQPFLNRDAFIKNMSRFFCNAAGGTGILLMVSALTNAPANLDTAISCIAGGALMSLAEGVYQSINRQTANKDNHKLVGTTCIAKTMPKHAVVLNKVTKLDPQSIFYYLTITGSIAAGVTYFTPTNEHCLALFGACQ